MKRALSLLLLCIVFVFAFASIASAQEATSTVSGFVTTLGSHGTTVLAYVIGAAVSGATVGLGYWGIRKAYRAFKGM